jgi:hypothetical protein
MVEPKNSSDWISSGSVCAALKVLTVKNFMDPTVIRIAARCVRYLRQQFLLDIQYGGIYWHGSEDPNGAWQSFDAWEQCQCELKQDLIELGVSEEELHWIAWELGLAFWWADGESPEFWQDPRVNTQWEIPQGTLH